MTETDFTSFSKKETQTNFNFKQVGFKLQMAVFADQPKVETEISGNKIERMSSHLIYINSTQEYPENFNGRKLMRMLSLQYSRGERLGLWKT